MSPATATKAEKPLLAKKYDDEVMPALMKRFKYDNKARCPRLVKIVLNVGTGKANAGGDAKFHDSVGEEMSAIAGQRAVTTLARISIANFKTRQGMKMGWKVTLRGARMYEFLQRFIHAAVPQIRDFRGLPATGFDGRGNYTLGLKDQLLFPEIDYMKVDKARGMNISVVTTAATDEESRKLLQLLGMPFRAS